MSATPRGTDSAQVIKVIKTEALKGKGTFEDPCFIVTQYWDFDGMLLAETPDPLPQGDLDLTNEAFGV